MLKVLLVYYEPVSSGQTTHVLSLARGLDCHRYRLTVVLPDHLHRSIKAFRQTPAQVVPLPLRKVRWSPRDIITLARLIRQQEVDIVHVHSQEAGLLARVVARMARAPRVIYTPQVIDIRRARWHWLYARIECVLAQITDMIVSVNESDRKRLIQWGIPSHKTVTIPNGINLNAFDESADIAGLRTALGLDASEDRPLVMQVGRLAAQKDPLTFVEGAALVARERPDVEFALLGEGPLRDAVTMRIRALGLEKRVHLLGWRDKASGLMSAANVVTLTSRWEGAPYTVLEAMACSRPVVATAVNGCPEMVVDGVTGYLVPPGNVTAWAERVADLLNDPARMVRMGQQGRERVEQSFALQEMVARIERLYLQVT